MGNPRRRVLITSFDMNIGGVERALIGLLTAFDYSRYTVDLFLYRQSGDLLDMLPDNGYNLLQEIAAYTTIRTGLAQVLCSGQWALGAGRLAARLAARVLAMQAPSGLHNVVGHQLTWDYSLRNLPELSGSYDTAISFLWPHHCVARKVNAARKIGWVHTDYSQYYTDKQRDLAIWDELDYIVAVSAGTRRSFVSVYPSLERKVIVIENMLPAELIRAQAAAEDVTAEMPRDGLTNILSVGRFVYPKAFDRAIEAAKALRDRGVAFRWYFIGYGPDENVLRRLIAQHALERQCIILGKRLNPYPYIKACDIYAQPSRFEGKAVTVQEAQLLNKPVIITDYPSAGSQIRNGIDGYIVPNSIEGITQGLETCIAHPKMLEKCPDSTGGIDYANAGEINKLYALLGE